MSTTDAGVAGGATPSATDDDRLAELLHETAEQADEFADRYMKEVRDVVPR